MAELSQKGKAADMEREVKGWLCSRGIGAEPPQHHGRVSWECHSWRMGTSAGTRVLWREREQTANKLEIRMCLGLHGGLRCLWILSPRAGEEELPAVCPAPSKRKIGCCFKPGQVEPRRNHMED